MSMGLRSHVSYSKTCTLRKKGALTWRISFRKGSQKFLPLSFWVNHQALTQSSLKILSVILKSRRQRFSSTFKKLDNSFSSGPDCNPALIVKQCASAHSSAPFLENRWVPASLQNSGMWRLLHPSLRMVTETTLWAIDLYPFGRFLLKYWNLSSKKKY